MVSPLRIIRAVRIILGVALLSLSPTMVVAQESAPTPARDSLRATPPDTIVELRLRDGSVLYGLITAQYSVHVALRTLGGADIDVKREMVVSLRVANGKQYGNEYWAADPNGTRLLFTSTGRALGKGEGYVSTYFLFFPFVAFGVTDRLTLAGGTPVIPGAIGRVFYFAPKFTIAENAKSAYSIGALSFALTEEIASGTTGLLYGVGTWGDRDNAFTAGAGWGYQWGNGNSSVSNSPVIVLGGETRIARRVKLVTENWILSGGGARGGLFSGGFRFIGDRLSGDLGLIGAAGYDEAFCCLPTVNFVWNFGRKSR